VDVRHRSYAEGPGLGCAQPHPPALQPPNVDPPTKPNPTTTARRLPVRLWRASWPAPAGL
jgi:hypothetical protein